MKEKLGVLTAETEGEADEADGQWDEQERGCDSTLTRVKDSLNDIVVLCHQSSQNLDQQQREVRGVTDGGEESVRGGGVTHSLTGGFIQFLQELWFPLLETMMASQKLVKGLHAKHTFEGKHTHTKYLQVYAGLCWALQCSRLLRCDLIIIENI